MKPLVIASTIAFQWVLLIGWGSIPFILMSELLPLQTQVFRVLAGMVARGNWDPGLAPIGLTQLAT